MSLDPDTVALAIAAAQCADAKKASDVVVIDVGDVLAVADVFVVCGASNRRLVATVADEVEAVLKRDRARSPVRVEGMKEQQWVLLDYGDVVVHVFLDETRRFYEIERLYRDRPRIAWQTESTEKG